MLLSPSSRCCQSRSVTREGSALARETVRPTSRVQSRQLTVRARAESDRSESFFSGFVLGGVVFGALGFLFAPQISKALLGDDQRLRLPRFLEEETKDPEQTKQELFDKIAQLNASIDEFSGKITSTKEASNGAVVAAEAVKVKA